MPTMKPNLKFAVIVAAIAAAAAIIVSWKFPEWVPIQRGVLIVGAVILAVLLSAPFRSRRQR